MHSHFDISTNTTTISSAPNVPDLVPLSAGSAFVLVTSLFAALIFHPFGGSLVYGPTLRFWMASPTSVAAELVMIFICLFKHCIPHLRSVFSYQGDEDHDNNLQDSNRCTFRNKMYNLVAARSMNAFGGDRRRTLHSNISDLPDFVRDSVRAISEGWRFRIAIVLPVVAQYIKLMAVSGPNTLTLKILGTLYFIHWLTLELLYLTAHEGENGSETVLRVQELLPLRNFSERQTSDALTDAFLETGESMIMSESISYLLHQIAAVIGSFIVIFCWSKHVVPVLVGVVVPWIWILKCKVQLDRRANSVARRVSNRPDWRAVRDVLSFGGPSVGADIGCIFFVYWILYCVYVYDSTGTLRPQWPWLNWLG